jgi:hypothetical protein
MLQLQSRREIDKVKRRAPFLPDGRRAVAAKLGRRFASRSGNAIMTPSGQGEELLGELLDLAGQLGLEVRRLPLGGSGGGLATLRGKQILFLDTDADSDVLLDRTAAGLSRLADRFESVYLRPAVRALLEGNRLTDNGDEGQGSCSR